MNVLGPLKFKDVTEAVGDMMTDAERLHDEFLNDPTEMMSKEDVADVLAGYANRLREAYLNECRRNIDFCISCGHCKR